MTITCLNDGQTLTLTGFVDATGGAPSVGSMDKGDTLTVFVGAGGTYELG